MTYLPFDFVESIKEELKVNGLERLDSRIWNYNDFILEYLDHGAFGMVYKAIHKDTQEKFALKVLTETDCFLGDSVKLFYSEILFLSKLAHPNVVKFMGITFDANRKICHLSEFIDGGTLFDLLTRQDELLLSWDTYLNISLDLARGMSYLHAMDIIHRDLKSKNVLLRQLSLRRYEAIIIDFGLCYQKPDGVVGEENFPVGPEGTVYYLAPELFKMEPCSKKTDVFSYGIILCEIAAGIPGADPDELPRNETFGLNVEKFSELSCDCPVEFLNLAVRCCQLNPKQRPAFEDIVKAIDIILDYFEEEQETFFGKTTDHSPSSYITTDDFFLDTSLFCSCDSNKKLTRSQTYSDIDKVRIKTVYNRFGGLERASSRKLLRKYLKRCGMCGGRMMKFEHSVIDRAFRERDRATSLPFVAMPEDHGQTKQTTPRKQSSTKDIFCSNIKSLNSSPVKRKDTIELAQNYCSTVPEDDEQENDKIDLTSDPQKVEFDTKTNAESFTSDINIVVTRSSPVQSPEPDSKEMPYLQDLDLTATVSYSIVDAHLSTVASPGSISCQSTGKAEQTLDVPNSPKVYTAAVLLKQDKTCVSSKTSLLLHNTPGRLPRLFQHLLKTRRNRSSFRLDDKRGIRSSWHKLFQRSPSGNLVSPRQSDVFEFNQSVSGSPRNTNRLDDHLTVRKRTNVENNPADYVIRRRSMPSFMKSWRLKTEPISSPSAVSLKSLPVSVDSSDNKPASIDGSDKQVGSLPSLKKARSRSLIDLILRRKNTYQ